jgi:hypothetical protein
MIRQIIPPNQNFYFYYNQGGTLFGILLAIPILNIVFAAEVFNY